MHILIVTSWYKNAETPVGGSFVEEQARMLQKRGHTVGLLHAYVTGTFVDTLRGAKEIISIEEDKGICTMRVATNVYIPKFRILSYNRLCRKSLDTVSTYIKKYGSPDIIHGHAMFMGGVVANFLGRELKIPYFHTEHSSGFIFAPNQYTIGDIKFARKVCKESQKCFFVSHFQLKKMQRILTIDNSKVQVMHNVVPASFFKEYSIDKNDAFTFVIICNLIPRKNVDMVVDAWEKYISHYSNDRLIIVGDGPLWNTIEKQIISCDLQKSVTMFHKMSRQEIVFLLQKVHVLISASDIETFGMTLAEALAVGIPIVTTDSGGIRDIITGDIGIIVTEKKADSILEGMLKIRKNYYGYKPCDLREYARDKFSEDVIYNSLMECYNVR